jgi:pimeloyl-ACP methyl ester carboxylesterase
MEVAMRIIRECLVLLCLFLASCSEWQTDGEHMFLRNDGADLPIWVRGNVASGTLLIWIAGGPGDPVAIVRGAATDRIEEHYGMVYWDQRGSGSAQGNAPPESFTMDQFVDDTDKVVDLVKARYSPERVFLIGHSWGGTLATAYLLDAKRQRKIAGFIDLGGNHDVPLVYPMKLAWLRDFASAFVERGIYVEHNREVLAFCESSPPLSRASLAAWEEFVDHTNAAFHDPNRGFPVGFDLLFRSGESAPAYLFVNADYVENSLYKSDAVLYEMSYSARMKAITIPTAALWGRYDGIVPLPAAKAALESLGTSPENKRLVAFEHSAHFPFLEEPEAFARAVVEFVEDASR